MMRWSDVYYVEEPPTDPRFQAYLAALRPLYANGRILFKCFQPTDPVAFHNAMRMDLNGLDHLLTKFLTAPTIQAYLKELQLPAPFKLPLYHYYSGYELEGALLATLLSGGAYHRFSGPENEARQLAREFVSAIGHAQAQVFKITEAWTPWFYDIAWDLSFVVLNTERMKWWVLCMTDTD